MELPYFANADQQFAIPTRNKAYKIQTWSLSRSLIAKPAQPASFCANGVDMSSTRKPAPNKSADTDPFMVCKMGTSPFLIGGNP
jgi:hypothetical protein